jgi:hypothetical protein
MKTDPKLEFNIDRVRTRFSKPEIAASLNRYAEVRGVQTFGMREYDAWDKRILSPETIRVTFNSWGKALMSGAVFSGLLN